MARGILKNKRVLAGFTAVSAIMLPAGFGLGVGLVVSGADRVNNAIDSYRIEPAFVQMQEEDISKLKEDFQNLDINEKEYFDRLNYLKSSSEYVLNVMNMGVEGNEEYQALVKTGHNIQLASVAGWSTMVLSFVGVVCFPRILFKSTNNGTNNVANNGTTATNSSTSGNPPPKPQHKPRPKKRKRVKIKADEYLEDIEDDPVQFYEEK